MRIFISQTHIEGSFAEEEEEKKLLEELETPIRR